VAPSPDGGAGGTLAAAPGFSVRVGDFDGPFDLLLTLITKRRLDITDVALSSITDEFLAYLKHLDTAEELDEASEFLVVAATLLDLKIVGLLPQGELVDAEDVALLEARDLLFARLLQYRAFKEASGWFADHLERESSRHVRSVRLEERFRIAPSDFVWSTTPAALAALATLALTPRELPAIATEHLHVSRVSIREQAAIVASLLQRGDPVSFRELAAAADPAVEVARFLAVLELYRNEAISFEQLEPLGELTLRWTADNWSEDRLADLGADYDD